MNRIPDIDIREYDYDLPEERIAQFPVKERDGSQLLIFNKGAVKKDIFRNIGEYLPDGSLLVFNDARVIRARLHFQKESGAAIEILCLEPVIPRDYERCFSSNGPAEWKCLVGNLKKWKKGSLVKEFIHNGENYLLTAEKLGAAGDAWNIRFRWDPSDLTMGEVLESAGHIPLPPYVKREDTGDDYIRYQTIYSKKYGSVAAPTAGLHFTMDVLEDIRKKGIGSAELTLHVGAGTFKPVKERDITQHEMHREHFVVTKQNLEHIYEATGRLLAAGTTSVRTLESLYWLGCKAMAYPEIIYNEPFISQWEWTRENRDISATESIGTILQIMDKKKLSVLTASTGIMIIPGYRFRMINGMITNFHQPRSTLLLLVSAWVGDDWKKIYEYALQNGFRFLSYGDASLLL